MQPSNFDHLGAILARKRQEISRRRRYAALYREAASAQALLPADFAMLRRPAATPPRVIAEIKFASPSKGLLRPRQTGAALWLAEQYLRGGAAAISVLADAPGFCGTPLDVRRVALAHPRVPVLFKEFVFDELQVLLARAVGATMVLLIVAALSDAQLRELIGCARQWGMEPLVEAANPDELQRALATSARLIGINARDLRSFRIDTTSAERCLSEIPDDRLAVWLSGVVDADGFRRVAASRADAVLIGEGLMTAANPGDRLRQLMAAGISVPA